MAEPLLITDLLQNLETIYIWQHQIKDDEIGYRLAKTLQGRLSISKCPRSAPIRSSMAISLRFRDVIHNEYLGIELSASPRPVLIYHLAFI
jgi:hypothetical protein